MIMKGRGKSLSADVGTISLGRLSAFGLSMIIPLVLTRVLSVEDYGIYKELSLLIITLQPILLFGIPSSLRYFIPRAETGDKGRYVTQAMVFTVLVGFALFITLAFAGGLITELLFQHNLSQFTLVLGAHGLFIITASYLGIVMIVNDDIKLAGLTAIAFSVLDVLFMCGGVLITKSIMGLLIAIALASLIKFMLAVIYVAKYFKPSMEHITSKGLRTQLEFSAPLGLSDIINILNINIDKFFIAFFFVHATFGIYSIGALITPVLLVIYRSVFDIVVPQFSKLYKARKFPELIKLWQEGVRKLALLFYPLFIFLILFADLIIGILFPEAYGESVPVFRIYLLLLPLTITFFNGVLIAAGETKFLLKATFATFLINLVLNYLLIRWFITMGFGILGPPTATIIVNVILRAFLLLQISVLMGRPVSMLYPWRFIANLFTVCLASGLITMVLMAALGVELLDGLLTIPGGYTGLVGFLDSLPDFWAKAVPLAIGFCVFFALYFVLASRMGLIRKSDWNMLKTFIGLKN
jgi:O-antigen/teichoic acid export membrane protein